MRKVTLYTLFALLLAASLTACSETEEVNKYENWRARSEAFIDSIANVYQGQRTGSIKVNDVKDSLYRFQDLTNFEWIYVKKLKDGNGTVSPYMTSTVNAYYRMSYFNGDVVQQNFTGNDPDSFGVGGAPSSFTLDGVISGWTYTLIHMKVGDYWTLYIPYQSAYADGTGSDGSLQAYSALVYNVKLDGIPELTR
ncbi:MAG: FKBP-type peptidyl-prolyl cis-trans isomerase [Mediterranea sp.]|jgi:FKBP-type peptidyl-prolyl cis-trans isomerase FklB|nr:FKBP-type peptidyl-prolyl cis-trans isomerase [Mediterranea sp.]